MSTNPSQPPCTIRLCRPDDVETLVELVRGLARYERLEPFMKATAEDFRTYLFGARPYAEALLAEQDGAAVGFALYFPTFSTFRGRPGIWLEDLFVEPEYRGRGIGKALVASVARTAVAHGYRRLEWSVLNWNAPAIDFYRGLGASLQDEWSICRIADEPLEHLSRLAPPRCSSNP
jgi:GNAT superfamily N-acetyltransferase